MMNLFVQEILDCCLNDIITTFSYDFKSCENESGSNCEVFHQCMNYACSK